MEKGQSNEETLPTVYGIMIAFLTCVVGYVLWVSVTIATNMILDIVNVSYFIAFWKWRGQVFEEKR